ncbi:MAG: hypothetical protein LUE14_05830 [Clostridiales bacterium]|nr:hypothetical protein [Clostridiales bacterium]
MNLDHETYTKAMADINLTDETGEQLLLRAQKRASTKKAGGKRLAAAAACAAVVVVAGTGISYAATGETPLGLFFALFEDNNTSEALELSEGFTECNETVTDGNLDFTLVRYWYDRENGIVYLESEISTNDGSSLNDQADIAEPWSFILDTEGSYIISETVTQDDTTLHLYEIHKIRNEESELTDEIICRVLFEENEVGSFCLENTGETASRTADLSEICTGASLQITGGILFISLPDVSLTDADDPLVYAQQMISQIDVEMSDGSVYQFWFSDLMESDTIDESDSTDTADTSQENRTLTESEASYVVSQLGIDATHQNDGFWQISMQGVFTNFIDVNEVTAVKINGKEVTLQQ